MTSKDFYNTLIGLSTQLSKEKLIAVGKPAEIAESYQNSIIIREREEYSLATQSNELDSFYQQFQVDNIEVFFVRFMPDLNKVGDFTIFAEEESDSIALNHTDGSIVMIPYYEVCEFELGEQDTITPNFLISESIEAFFEAISVVIEYSTHLALSGKVLSENKQSAKAIVEKCTKISGGNQYAPFWEYLLLNG